MLAEEERGWDSSAKPHSDWQGRACLAALTSENTHYRKQPNGHWSRMGETKQKIAPGFYFDGGLIKKVAQPLLSQ